MISQETKNKIYLTNNIYSEMNESERFDLIVHIVMSMFTDEQARDLQRYYEQVMRDKRLKNNKR